MAHSKNQASRERYISLIVLVLGTIIVLAYQYRGGIVDDAFITYRYTANLVQGNGLVYNPGEMVMGTTTPGYALILAPFAAIFGWQQIPLIARLLNAVLLVMLLILYYRIGTKAIGRPYAGAVGVISLVLAYYVMVTGVFGMEMPLFHVLLSAGLLAMLHERYHLTSVMIGLLPLVRPEGIFAIGLFSLTLLCYVYQKKLTWRQVLLPMVILYVPGLCYAGILAAFYGSPLPQSVQAKRAGIYPLSIKDSLVTVIEFVGTSYTVYLVPLFGTSFIARLIAAALVMLVACIGGVWLAKRHIAFWVLPMLLLLLLTFFGLSATLIFQWYYGLFHSLLMVCFVVGTIVVSHYISKQWIPNRVFATFIIVATSALSLFTALLLWLATVAGTFAPVAYPYINWNEQRMNALYTVSTQLKAHLPADTVIAAPEIGVLGFILNEQTILDTAGLVSPQATTYLPVPPEQRVSPRDGVIPPRLIAVEQPDLVITLERFGRFGLLDETWFHEQYTAVIVCPQVTTFDSNGLYVFSRNDFAAGISLADLNITCTLDNP